VRREEAASAFRISWSGSSGRPCSLQFATRLKSFPPCLLVRLPPSRSSKLPPQQRPKPLNLPQPPPAVAEAKRAQGEAMPPLPSCLLLMMLHLL
jgi:hypothetical protein